MKAQPKCTLYSGKRLRQALEEGRLEADLVDKLDVSLYDRIADMRDRLDLPTTITGETVAHPAAYIDLITETAVALGSVDAREFAKKFIEKDATYTNSDTGMAALEFETFLLTKRRDLYEKFVETQVRPGSSSFLAIFEGKWSDMEFERLRSTTSSIATFDMLVNGGSVAPEDGVVSDVVILEGKPVKGGRPGPATKKKDKGSEEEEEDKKPEKEPELAKDTMKKYEEAVVEKVLAGKLVEHLFDVDLEQAQLHRIGGRIRVVAEDAQKVRWVTTDAENWTPLTEDIERLRERFDSMSSTQLTRAKARICESLYDRSDLVALYEAKAKKFPKKYYFKTKHRRKQGLKKKYTVKELEKLLARYKPALRKALKPVADRLAQSGNIPDTIKLGGSFPVIVAVEKTNTTKTGGQPDTAVLVAYVEPQKDPGYGPGVGLPHLRVEFLVRATGEMYNTMTVETRGFGVEQGKPFATYTVQANGKWQDKLGDWMVMPSEKSIKAVLKKYIHSLSKLTNKVVTEWGDYVGASLPSSAVPETEVDVPSDDIRRTEVEAYVATQPELQDIAEAGVEMVNIHTTDFAKAAKANGSPVKLKDYVTDTSGNKAYIYAVINDPDGDPLYLLYLLGQDTLTHVWDDQLLDMYEDGDMWPVEGVPGEQQLDIPTPEETGEPDLEPGATQDDAMADTEAEKPADQEADTYTDEKQVKIAEFASQYGETQATTQEFSNYGVPIVKPVVNVKIISGDAVEGMGLKSEEAGRDFSLKWAGLQVEDLPTYGGGFDLVHRVFAFEVPDGDVMVVTEKQVEEYLKSEGIEAVPSVKAFKEAMKAVGKVYTEFVKDSKEAATDPKILELREWVKNNIPKEQVVNEGGFTVKGALKLSPSDSKPKAFTSKVGPAGISVNLTKLLNAVNQGRLDAASIYFGIYTTDEGVQRSATKSTGSKEGFNLTLTYPWNNEDLLKEVEDRGGYIDQGAAEYVTYGNDVKEGFDQVREWYAKIKKKITGEGLDSEPTVTEAPPAPPSSPVIPDRVSRTVEDLKNLTFDTIEKYEETEGVGKHKGKLYRKAYYAAVDAEGNEKIWLVKVSSEGGNKIEEIGRTDKESYLESVEKFKGLKPEVQNYLSYLQELFGESAQLNNYSIAEIGRALNDPKKQTLFTVPQNPWWAQRFMEVFNDQITDPEKDGDKRGLMKILRKDMEEYLSNNPDAFVPPTGLPVGLSPYTHKPKDYVVEGFDVVSNLQETFDYSTPKQTKLARQVAHLSRHKPVPFNQVSFGANASTSEGVYLPIVKQNWPMQIIGESSVHLESVGLLFVNGPNESDGSDCRVLLRFEERGQERYMTPDTLRQYGERLDPGYGSWEPMIERVKARRRELFPEALNEAVDLMAVIKATRPKYDPDEDEEDDNFKLDKTARLAEIQRKVRMFMESVEHLDEGEGDEETPYGKKMADFIVKTIQMAAEPAWQQACRSMINHVAKGDYDREQAVKKFLTLSNAAYKGASKVVGIPYLDVTPQIRQRAAEMMRDQFEREAKKGKFDKLAYKKYQESGFTGKTAKRLKEVTTTASTGGFSSGGFAMSVGLMRCPGCGYSTGPKQSTARGMECPKCGTMMVSAEGDLEVGDGYGMLA
jgi:hypothetical protein